MEKKKCVQCGKIFTITDSEKRFYESRNLNFPKRCKGCREINNPHKVNVSNKQVTLSTSSCTLPVSANFTNCCFVKNARLISPFMPSSFFGGSDG